MNIRENLKKSLIIFSMISCISGFSYGMKKEPRSPEKKIKTKRLYPSSCPLPEGSKKIIKHKKRSKSLLEESQRNVYGDIPRAVVEYVIFPYLVMNGEFLGNILSDQSLERAETSGFNYDGWRMLVLESFKIAPLAVVFTAESNEDFRSRNSRRIVIASLYDTGPHYLEKIAKLFRLCETTTHGSRSLEKNFYLVHICFRREALVSPEHLEACAQFKGLISIDLGNVNFVGAPPKNVARILNFDYSDDEDSVRSTNSHIQNNGVVNINIKDPLTDAIAKAFRNFKNCVHLSEINLTGLSSNFDDIFREISELLQIKKFDISRLDVSDDENQNPFPQLQNLFKNKEFCATIEALSVEKLPEDLVQKLVENIKNFKNLKEVDLSFLENPLRLLIGSTLKVNLNYCHDFSGISKEKLLSLRAVSLDGTDTVDKKFLACLPASLEKLSFRGCEKLEPEDFKVLMKFNGLIKLCLNETNIDDTSLEFLKRLKKLKTLYLCGCPNIKGYNYFVFFGALQELAIEGAPVESTIKNDMSHGLPDYVVNAIHRDASLIDFLQQVRSRDQSLVLAIGKKSRELNKILAVTLVSFDDARGDFLKK